jgi:hypothetical protein
MRAIIAMKRGRSTQKGSRLRPPLIAALCGCRIYFGASTKIRCAVMVKVPLMLGIGLPFRSR